ncbi:MAG: hydroxymethylglutaryl-CoA lyase [Flavobacteriales bacterium]|nr:hydroxymethylglutaryl-CoA lyase [Flavobacteriales bacterium]
MIKIIECPRDAMQGLHEFIPTETKAAYINQLLKVGFDTIDFGSFVSPKAIPQMRDTAEVLNLLHLDQSKSKLLAIVANNRGALDAVQFSEISYLGFPFSISETFQQRNTNSSIEQSLKSVEEIQNLCVVNKKKLVVYISMAFGNPYGDKWNSDIVIEWSNKLASLGIEIIALSDTIGISNSENISYLFSRIIPELSTVEIGAHLHTTPTTWKEKIEAAFKNGCKRFDGAIKGYGGCPMATDKLTGNMATENLVDFFKSIQIKCNINQEEFNAAMIKAAGVFPQ